MDSRRGLRGMACVLWALGAPGCVPLDWEDIEEASEEPADAGACAASGWALSGTVQVGERVLDYGGGRATVWAVHKLDADAVEDGCLGRFEVTLALARGECPMKLVFMGKNGAFGGLMEARLTADSACPGFLDAVEGTYASPAGFAPWSYEGPSWTVSEHGAAALCHGEMRLGFPSSPFRLYRAAPSPAELTVNLGGVELRGELASRGEHWAKCFEATGCGPGWHDGGDGWCVEASRCSPGYRRLPTGDCAQ